MSIKKLLLSAVILLVAFAQSKGTSTQPIGSAPTLAQKVAFLAYTARYGKSYSSTVEFNARFKNWLATETYISSFANNQVKLRHNKFSDWSHDEKNGVLNSKLASEIDLPEVAQLLSMDSMLDPNSKTVSGILTATSCPAGQYLSGTLCLACPTGCKTCISATYCTACLTTNFYLNPTTKLCTCTVGPLNTAKTDCVPCISGSYYSGTGTTCTACLTGCSTCTSTTTCSLCANNYQFIGGKCVCNGPVDAVGWCTPCASNEFYSATTGCQTCAGNCTTCTTGSGACTACSASYTLSGGKCACATGQTLVNNVCTTAIACTTGTYNLNNTCTSCPTFCSACISGKTCTSCVNSNLKLVNSTDVVPCYNCDPTFRDTPVGQCRCPPNTLLVGSLCPNLATCAAASYNTGDGTCVPCEANCAVCASFSSWCYSTTDPSFRIDATTGTVYCPPETVLLSGKCATLVKCATGKYNDGQNNCLSCVENCDVCTNVTGVCQTCSQTFTLKSDNTCSCVTATQFLDVNTASNTGTCIDLKNCGSGFFNPGWNNCTACVSNCAKCSDVTGLCTECAATYTLGSNKCACNPDTTKQWYNAATNQCVDITSCLAGQYNDGQNNCLACPNNCATCAFKTGVCSACNSTFTATAANTCICNVGQFMTAAKNGVCQACNSLCPTCQDLTGDCLTCINNLAVKTTTTPKTCACTSGQYLKTSNNMCTTCATNCTTCIDSTGLCDGCVATYTLTAGACACKSDQAFTNSQCLDMAACPSGYYNQGNNVCTVGPANCTKVANLTGLCTTCNDTFTYVSLTNACQCSSNQFMNSSGYCQTCNTNCSTCDATGSCTSCQPTYTQYGSKCACNTTSTSQALVGGSCVTLISCPPGKYNTGINTCATCAMPKCGACNTFNGVCTACASTFTATLDATGAVASCACISGQFLNNNGQCQACAQNCTTCSDGTGLCTSCGVGFTMNLPTTGACACNPTTQAFVNGACVGLTTCPAAQYASNINVCTACPSYCTVCSQIYGKCSTCQNNLVVVTASNTCACVNNTFAFDGSQCQRCNVWVGSCNTCNSAGTCTACMNGYVVSGNSCVCNTGSGQYLDSTGYCNNCPANCTTCYSYGNGYNFPPGQCSGCVSTFTSTSKQVQVYYAPSGYGWGWYILGTSNYWPPYLSPGSYAQSNYYESNHPYIEGQQMPPNVCNYLSPYYWQWQWNGYQFQGVTALYDYCSYCYGCWWQYFFQSYRSYSCACVTGSQTKNTAGQCAAIISCPAQQYNDGTNTCKSCGTRCNACSYETSTCTSCYTGATYNSGSNVCSCPVGQYGSTSTQACAACPTNCIACAENTGVCTTCVNNLEKDTTTGICGCPQSQMLALVSGYCVPMTTPAVGYYNPGNNTAVACATSNCYNCTAYSGVCNTCNTSFVMSGSSCVCAAGKYKTSASVCMACPKNCTACNDFTGVCNTCSSTYSLNLPTTGYCGCSSSVPAVVNGLCAAFLTCPAGQYNPGNNVCYACPDNCATCDAWTGTCNACKATFTFTASDNSCQCTSAQYLTSASACANCATNCTACAATTGACTSCSASFSVNVPSSGKCGCLLDTQALVSGSCVALLSCPAGQYNPGNNVCTNCATDCETCQAYTGTCSKCKTTFINGTTPNTCVCPSAQFKNSQSTCQNCDANCTACTGSNACTTCATTFVLNSGVCGCTTGNYLSSSTGTCLRCPTNCTVCSNGVGACTACATSFDVQPSGACSCNPITEALVNGACVPLVSCPIGQYNPGNNVCSTCTTNCYSCAPYTGACTQCLPTFTYNSAPNTCTCTTKQYKVTSTTPNTCADCAANCTTCADTTGLCTQCVATFSANTPSTGQCACNPTTQALVNGQCLSMLGCAPQGTYNPGDNTCAPCLDSNCKTCLNYTGICSVCLPTFTLTDTKSCICTSSQYLDASNLCQNCKQNCSACQAITGACNTCSPTFALDATTSQCKCTGTTPVLIEGSCVELTVCPAGEFNPGNNVCKACPLYAATCADYTGLITACKETFTQNSTSNKCICTAAQYFTSTSTCVNCPVNCTSCANSTGLCKTCKTSMTLSTAGACSCLPTQTLVNGVCVAITTCPSGQYNPGNNTCKACSTTCTACSYWTGACTTCKTSFTLNANGTCTCLVNQFLNQTTTTTQTCIGCPNNCTTCIAPKGSCTGCVNSYTLVTGTLATCACKSTEVIIKGLCVTKATCATGQFVNTTNQCQACPSNCTSCTSLTACTACVSTFTLTTGKCACTSAQAFVGGNSCSTTFTKCPTGQYNDGTNTCVAMPSNCTVCNNTGYCSGCKTSFTTNTPKPGMCACNSSMAFVNGVCVKPTTCPLGQYNPGNNTCLACASSCSACTLFTGACTTCKPTFTLSAGKCICLSTQALVNNACTTLYNCTAGNYNLGNNTCAPCTANCVTCAAFTGACSKCAIGYNLASGTCQPARMLQTTKCGSSCTKCDPISGECLQCAPNSIRSLTNPESCDQCNFAVGPVGNATICLVNQFSSDRVVPEFSASDTTIDWRSWSIVGSVKDQGKCGGDFAFSTAAAAETAYAIKTGQLYDLSEQYLIDCDVGSFGCGGGYMSSSSKLLATEGAVLEKDYPYVGSQTGCRGNQVDKVFQLKYPGSRKIQSSKDEFKAALRRGPLNVSFRVTDDSFFFYGDGILPGNLCPVGNLNHAMLAVGYGVENSIEYALIQNQWGVGWGEQGLIRVELTDDKEGPCGLYLKNSTPTV